MHPPLLVYALLCLLISYSEGHTDSVLYRKHFSIGQKPESDILELLNATQESFTISATPCCVRGPAEKSLRSFHV